MSKEIENADAGARFVRGDLHIHSFGGSYDVKDKAATPSAIVDKARERGVSIIALTDHNHIDNVQAFLAAAESYVDIVAIPAVELSCPEGHLLVYTPTFDALQTVFGPIRTPVINDATGETTCHSGMADVLDRVAAVDGFALLAHVDINSGFEQSGSGWTPQKKGIFCHRALLGCEVRTWPSDISYDEDDPDAERKSMGRERIRELKLPKSLYRFARVVNSDAHELAKVGENHAGRVRTTRYKLGSLTFEALKIALMDPGARVRIEDGLQEAIPRLIGMKLTGGFLDGSLIRFSPNLTCVIGGRGTGKTTAIKCAESVAHLHEDLEWNESMEVLESDVGPDNLELIVEDGYGSTFSVHKSRGACAVAVDGDGNEFDPGFPIDVFRQSEASDLAPKVRRDPGALLNYLDNRIPGVRELLEEDEGLRTRLAEAQSASLEAYKVTTQCEDRLKGSRSADAQVKQADKADAKALTKLEKERSRHRQVGDRARGLEAALREVRAERPLEPVRDGYSDLLEPDPFADEGEPPPHLSAVGDALVHLDDELTRWLHEHIDPLLVQVAAKVTDLKAAEKVAAQKVSDKKDELRAKGVVFDSKRLARLADLAVKLPQHELALKKAKKRHQDALAEEARLIKERRELHSKISTARTRWAERVLRGIPKTDLRIILRFLEGRCSPDARGVLTDEMRWRTNQQKRADGLLGEFGFWGLYRTLSLPRRGKEEEAIALVTGVAKGALFNKQEARELVERLSKCSVMRRLALCRVDDFPQLRVGRMSSRTARRYSRLSIGQQQSVLLTLLLADDAANNPLLLDQPEDNLDSEFVFKAIVPALRQAKERRQIVIVTHNANICVLGDAEQIVVLKSAQDQAQIVAVGAIESEDLRSKACEVLEGTEEAFRLRGQMYGVMR